jgi:hypothetical protein
VWHAAQDVPNEGEVCPRERSRPPPDEIGPSLVRCLSERRYVVSQRRHSKLSILRVLNAVSDSVERPKVESRSFAIWHVTQMRSRISWMRMRTGCRTRNFAVFPELAIASIELPATQPAPSPVSDSSSRFKYQSIPDAMMSSDLDPASGP